MERAYFPPSRVRTVDVFPRSRWTRLDLFSSFPVDFLQRISLQDVCEVLRETCFAVPMITCVAISGKTPQTEDEEGHSAGRRAWTEDCGATTNRLHPSVHYMALSLPLSIHVSRSLYLSIYSPIESALSPCLPLSSICLPLYLSGPIYLSLFMYLYL